VEGFEVRACAPEERILWAEFLDKSFGYEAASTSSYAVDFAPLFEPGALERSRLVWKDGSIVSSATLYPVSAVTPSRRLELAIIGAVATRDDCRGQGLSTRVMRELEDQALALGRDGIVLWSDKQEFYQRFGFAPAGRQLVYALAELAPPDGSVGGKLIQGWDWSSVRAIYQRHQRRVDRAEDYWTAIRRVRSCTRVQWISESGEVLAYLGFDRGHDLRGVIHEWGGEAPALHALVHATLKSRPDLCWLTHPSIEDPIRQALGASSSPLLDGNLALFKPLSSSVAPRDLDDAWFWGLDSL
jgi:predicted N-acetyltransferase YhbS